MPCLFVVFGNHVDIHDRSVYEFQGPCPNVRKSTGSGVLTQKDPPTLDPKYTVNRTQIDPKRPKIWTATGPDLRCFLMGAWPVLGVDLAPV